MRKVIASVAFLVLVGSACAEDTKIDAKKLIGKWEVKEPLVNSPVFVLEFADAGKLIVYAGVGEKKEKVEGTYKLDGNKLEVTLAKGGKEKKDTLTVTKLTDDEMVTKDSKGKEETLKRVKAK